MAFLVIAIVGILLSGGVVLCLAFIAFTEGKDKLCMVYILVAIVWVTVALLWLSKMYYSVCS